VGRTSLPQNLQTNVEACLKAKIATAEVLHIDASLIRANVSWDRLVERHVQDVLSENRTEQELEVERGRQSGQYKKICTNDPDATMATNARNRQLEPAYKQHTAVDAYAQSVWRDAIIPAKAEPIKSRVSLRRFRYDAKHNILKCPQGRIMRPARPIKHGRFFYSKAKDCARCPLKGDCLSKGRVNKAVVVVYDGLAVPDGIASDGA
jgi:hypothetical protein